MKWSIEEAKRYENPVHRQIDARIKEIQAQIRLTTKNKKKEVSLAEAYEVFYPETSYTRERVRQILFYLNHGKIPK